MGFDVQKPLSGSPERGFSFHRGVWRCQSAGMTLSINANSLICRDSRLEDDEVIIFPTVSV